MVPCPLGDERRGHVKKIASNMHDVERFGLAPVFPASGAQASMYG